MSVIELKVFTDITPQVLRRQEERTYDAIERGVIRTVELGERTAKRLAPVRKVSEITRRARKRTLTRAEIGHLPARIRRSMSADQLSRLQTTVRRAEQTLVAPEIKRDITGFNRLRNQSDETFLTQRGRAELREAGRTAATTAIYREGRGGTGQRRALRFRQANVRETLGGRLRGEIRYREVATRIGGMIRYRLESPTEYARYVEFPTSRTAAQPYMRPARAAMKKVLRRNIVREVERIGWRVRS